MTIAYRTCGPGEVEAAIAAGELPFGDTVRPADAAYYAELVEPERTVLAEEAGRIVGVGAAMSHDCSVPGGPALPLCAVGLVSVLPTHRRRGVARSLVERLHRAAVERGEPLAGLMASESGIYGRFGYGVATHWAVREIATAHARLREPPAVAGRVRFVEPPEAVDLALRCLDALRAAVPGIPGRVDTRVRGHLTRDPDHWRSGAGARMLVAYEDRGLVAYRIKQAWTAGGPDHTLLVEDLVAVDDEALAGLWAYCLGVDLVGSVRAQCRPLDEPLVHLLADPRRLRDTVTDALWLRVLDVPAALEGRRYDADGGWTLEIDDDGPAAGRHALEVRDGAAAVTPAGGAPDVTLPADTLAAAYLGGARLTGYARAGRAVEHTPGALRGLDRALAWDPLPWCPFEL